MAKNTKTELFSNDQHTPASGQVECMGITFSSDEARRAHFTELLRNKLKDSYFRNIEGFPTGDDTDILSLSDPPFYTACPNPFISELVKAASDATADNYSRDPFAADVSEGKSDPIYNVHGYHTKVPHKAIMRYILHYTQPGDVVFDGFCGTGMTGVAAQLCADKAAVEALGYKVRPDGTLLTTDGLPFSRLGTRTAVLGDLSPAATFIAQNYNTPTSSALFHEEASRILSTVEADCGWMYLTLDRPKPTQIAEGLALLKEHQTDLRAAGTGLPWGRINYSIWSDVFLCSECSGEVVFWNAAVDKHAGKVRDDFPCPHCKARLTKRGMERAFSTFRDSALNETIKQAKQVPVLINYTRGKDRLEKTPDDFDRALLQVIEGLKNAAWFPSKRMPEGDECRRNDDSGITHMHHFYARRNLRTLSALWEQSVRPQHRWLVTGILQRASKQHQIAISRIGGPKAGEGGATAGHRRGTLYIPSNQVEFNPCDLFKERMAIAVKAFASLRFVKRSALIYCGSASHSTLPDNSVDYVFTDPPFGGNIMYSELNTVWEAWLGVQTNNEAEAVTSSTQEKDIASYTRIMLRCFQEYYRVLKPNRWVTVEFHNSSNAVWTAIQEALQQAGFVVADVRMLDKQIKTHTQRTAAASVNKDLAITGYKPAQSVEEEFRLVAGTEAGAWEFVRSHLRHIPVFVATSAGKAEVIAERLGYCLFDRMVAFHVQRGHSVPVSASEFYAGMRQKFPERDGMYFLPDQVSEYDRQRMAINEFEQLQLFVNDERSAIQWVRHQLNSEAMSYQALSPLYMKEAQRVWEKHEQPLELLTILEQNFVRDGNDTWRVPDPRKEADLEQLRHRALLKEFQQYVDTKGKLKVVRTEALRAGFKESWQKKDYTTIVQMAKRVPDAVIQEDQALLMYFDNASLMQGE
jgi:hypothetical protein